MAVYKVKPLEQGGSSSGGESYFRSVELISVVLPGQELDTPKMLHIEFYTKDNNPIATAQDLIDRLEDYKNTTYYEDGTTEGITCYLNTASKPVVYLRYYNGDMDFIEIFDGNPLSVPIDNRAIYIKEVIAKVK